MSKMTTFVRQELLALTRERLPLTLFIVFVSMISASSFIGWLTKTTVSDVWIRTREAGLTNAANPFANVSPLYYARNSIIYIILIGTLMAIVAGVASALRDRKAGTVDLILSRPTSRAEYIFGKLIGISIWLALSLSIVGFIAATVITAIYGAPLPFPDYLRLAAFFLLALPLMVGFAAVGLLGGLLSRRETGALLAPISFWAFVTFVIPQVGTAARPIALLNPVPVPPTPGGPFDALNLFMGPMAVSEQFKAASGLILQDPDIAGNLSLALLSIFAFVLVAALLVSTVKRTSIRGVLSE